MKSMAPTSFVGIPGPIPLATDLLGRPVFKNIGGNLNKSSRLHSILGSSNTHLLKNMSLVELESGPAFRSTDIRDNLDLVVICPELSSN